MSRFEKSNEKFDFVFGLDRHFGPFFQVYARGEGDEAPLLDCDNTGIRSEPKQAAHLSRALARLLFETYQRFADSAARGNPRPNIDAVTIDNFAKACGFENLYSEIASALDAPP